MKRAIQTMQQVLVKNKHIVACEQNAKEWLSSAPRGAYTTARTVDGNSVFEFETHVHRLEESALLMMDDEDTHRDLATHDVLRPSIISSVSSGIKKFQLENPDYKGEFKLTLLLTWGNGDVDLYCHTSKLPDRPGSPVCIGILGSPRENAAAKDSQWVRDRKHLEEKMKAHMNELVLAKEGRLYEGLSSNFYAVKDGRVITADEGILKGSVRKLILKVCEQENIPVVLEPPLLKDASTFDGAFISSTSRLLLPVEEMTIYSDNDMTNSETKKFNDNSLLVRLEKLVINEVRNHCTKLF